VGERRSPVAAFAVCWSSSTPRTVEGVALLQRGGRLEPIAMRLDAAGSRWQVTVLQYAPVTAVLHRGQVAA
jgi:uncharacterized protein DUF6459